MAVKEINKVREIIDTNKAYNRSAWKRGVKEYAHELLDELEEQIDNEYVDIENLESSYMLRKSLLNGAENWKRYSEGGCSLIYDSDIAERLCTQTELTRTNYGERNPSRDETWIDVQGRALGQACYLIMEAFKIIAEEEKGA